jgi:hypothetical protein
MTQSEHSAMAPCAVRSGRFSPRYDHRYAPFVIAVVVVEKLDEIVFFEEDANEDIGGGRGGALENAIPGLRRGGTWYMGKTLELIAH